MTYKVVWGPDALLDFGELWTSAADKAAISQAAHLLEQDLARNPRSPRYEIVNGLGTAIRDPIGVDFIVDPQLQTVTVSTAWLATGSEG
jgi:hypothetical protein